MTDCIRIRRLDPQGIEITSLDSFVRHQEVYECWRKIDGEWKLMPVRFTENWDLDKLRKNATELRQSLHKGCAGFGAYDGELLCGFALLGAEIFDTDERYIALKEIHVSEPYRGMHIGGRLFDMCVREARARGASKLYISAHSSKESQAFYRAMGCVDAAHPDADAVRLEPYDVQMEITL